MIILVALKNVPGEEPAIVEYVNANLVIICIRLVKFNILNCVNNSLLCIVFFCLGWIGEGCDCSTDQRQCMALGSTELCSGHGNCVCGHCQCVSNSEKRYAGKFCERCTNCPEQRYNFFYFLLCIIGTYVEYILYYV